MKTMLEAKIGTSLANDWRNVNRADHSSRKTVVVIAMRRRAKFNKLAKASPLFRKVFFEDRKTRTFYIGMAD